MIVTQTWKLPGGIHRTSACEILPGESYPASRAFCCPTCGEVWARQEIYPSDHWMFFTNPCPNCSGGIITMRSGSVWQSWDREYLSRLPKYVLMREVLNNERLRKEHEK